jgi:hypothetical protein
MTKANIMNLRVVCFVVLTVFVLGGCGRYALVPADEPSLVGNSLVVRPSSAWNVLPLWRDQPDWEETWTRNGPLLETITFVGGMPEGKALRKQRKKDDSQIPIFRADMTPQDLVSMIEASYRTRGIAVFEIESVDTIDFLGGKGLKARYNYAPDDGISKKGSCVLRVIDKKLDLMTLDGVSSHYFDAAVPEFDQLVSTATKR